MCVFNSLQACKNFIWLYQLAMASSKQKHLDAYFNSFTAEWRTNEEPEAKKYRPFLCKYDSAYIKFGFVSNDGCLSV